MTIEYHQSELAIALDPSNPARAMPIILPEHKRILDVGCGMGQSLLAAQLAPDVEAYGVDCDMEAIEAGRRLAPANVHLACAGGEKLPFEDGYFDLVFSRVAIPYMEIDKALHEISRVLKQGGDVWLTLHPASMVLTRAKRSMREGRLKDAFFCGYVLLNGAMFNSFGIQVSLLGRQETYQTLGGIAKAMKRAGLKCLSKTTSTHFIVQGKKTIP
jgi:SAM-dependent methyltransferase